MKLELEFFSTLTIRSKVAFVEWLGRAMLGQLEDAAHDVAMRALNAVSRWQQGERVSGDELNDLLLDNEDEGLFAYIDARQPRPSDAAINVIGGATTYTAWQAYRLAGEYIPQGIDQTTDGFVQWIIDEAEGSGKIEAERVRRALQYLYAHFTGMPDVLGRPVGISEINNAAQGSP